MACNHEAGFIRNTSGDMNVVWIVPTTGAKTNPMSPMSWKRGNQVMAESTVGSIRSPSTMMLRMFASRLPCVRTTPLGLEVEPLVNCRKAMSSGPRAAGRRRALDSCRVEKVVTVSRAGEEAFTVPSRGLMTLEVMRAFAPLLATMCLVLSR